MDKVAAHAVARHDLAKADEKLVSCDSAIALILQIRPSTAMAPPEVDYSLYLVTDSTPAILGDKDLVAVVKAAVEGGTHTLAVRNMCST